MLSTSRSLPFSSGNDFFTPCSVTASRACVMPLSRQSAVGRTSHCTGLPPHGALPKGNGIDWHPNATPQQQRAEDKEEFVCLVLGQFVQVEDLNDVSASVPDKISVQRQAEKAEGF